jgi:hypothetical protein
MIRRFMRMFLTEDRKERQENQPDACFADFATLSGAGVSEHKKAAPFPERLSFFQSLGNYLSLAEYSLMSAAPMMSR